jgi:hypothetical protein
VSSDDQAVFTFRHTRLWPADIAWIKSVADASEGGSVRAVVVAICQRFGWRRINGEYPFAACTVMLRQLEQRGLIRLPRPPKLARPGGARHQYTDRQTFLRALGVVPGMAECQPSGEFSVRPIANEERDGFRLHLERFHYLGFERSVGESIGYAAFVGNDLVALLDWGAAVLHCGPRDRYIGWDSATRERNLDLVADNRRFLILPWIRQPHLASRILGANLRRLSGDWAARYGHPIAMAETFVDSRRFRGTCYRASNWVHLGETRGFTRLKRGFAEHNRQKSVFLYPLARDACRVLRTRRDRDDHLAA